MSQRNNCPRASWTACCNRQRSLAYRSCSAFESSDINPAPAAATCCSAADSCSGRINASQNHLQLVVHGSVAHHMHACMMAWHCMAWLTCGSVAHLILHCEPLPVCLWLCPLRPPTCTIVHISILVHSKVTCTRCAKL